MTTDEVQLFDGVGAYFLRVSAAEPLWRVLRDGLHGAGIVAAGDSLKEDLSVEGSELAALLENIGAALRERLSRIAPTGPAGYYDETTITVFGEPMSIRVRDPGHNEVMRLNDLYQCLARIIDSGQRADLFALPKLSTIDHGIIGVLEAGSPGLDIDALAASVSQRFTGLESRTSEPDIRDSLRRHRESITRAMIAERLERLVHWGLAEHGPGGAISASPKLRRILH
jgi:hypothetical protein